MDVFLVEADGAFGGVLIPEAAASYASLAARDGRPCSEPWTPPVVTPTDDFVPTNCSFSYSVPTLLLDRRAREELGLSLEPCGEFLPIVLGGYDYCWFNCHASVDAGDWERTEGEGRRSNPRHSVFRTIRRYEFLADRLAVAPAIFRLECGGLDLLCTDLLKDAVERADLTGFAFEHLWSSETGGSPRRRPGIEGTLGEAGRQLAERNERTRREMLDRMAATGSRTPIVPAGKRRG